MTVKPIPDGYNRVQPYLLVRDVPRQIEFLTKTFGAWEIMRTTGGSGGTHAEVRIGDSVIMMAVTTALGSRRCCISIARTSTPLISVPWQQGESLSRSPPISPTEIVSRAERTQPPISGGSGRTSRMQPTSK